MTTTLIRSRAALLPKKGRHQVETVPDGAVLQEDGVIVEVGTFEALHRKYPDTQVVGTGNEILLPGFVNGHHHQLVAGF